MRYMNLSPVVLASLAGTCLSGGAAAQPDEPFPGLFELSLLDGTNGFVVNGSYERARSGGSVSSAGDINGDGIDDLIIGADSTRDYYPNYHVGKSYVVFGGAEVGSSGLIDLSSLNGTNGFVLNGVDTEDHSGYSVSSAGDVNSDGVDDLIIGAPRPYAFAPMNSVGESYVVFGGFDVGSSGSIELSSLDGSNGFVLTGIDVDDRTGGSVSSAGDINGDGVDDLLIGAYRADPNGNVNAGESYVVFGGFGVGSSGVIELSLLNGTNGFVLNGSSAGGESGISVSPAGDVNGDGVDDLIIGAPRSDQTYVIFGRDLSPCVGDVNGDGMLSPADFTAWIAAFNAMAPECDQNGDGSCTPADFTAWIVNYNAGCS